MFLCLRWTIVRLAEGMLWITHYLGNNVDGLCHIVFLSLQNPQACIVPKEERKSDTLS